MRRIFRRLWPAFFLLAAGAAVVVAIHFFAADADWRSHQESYPKDNFTWIDDGLCVGGILSEPPPGVRAVLNVCETKDPYEAEVQRWQPIPDLGPSPGLDWLKAQVAFIDEQRKAGRAVYVHCRAGVNRGPTVMAAYLMWRDRLGRDEALAVIKAKRPRIGPYAVYLGLLSEWEKSLPPRRKHGNAADRRQGVQCADHCERAEFRKGPDDSGRLRGSARRAVLSSQTSGDLHG